MGAGSAETAGSAKTYGSARGDDLRLEVTMHRIAEVPEVAREANQHAEVIEGADHLGLLPRHALLDGGQRGGLERRRQRGARLRAHRASGLEHLDREVVEQAVLRRL